MKRQDVIVPSGMIPYQCGLSGRCCGGWSIGLNKPSYNRIKNVLVKNKQTRLFKENIKKLVEKKNHYYAQIKFKNGKCGLLEDSGLCGIHRRFGLEALPDICKGYPRLVSLTPNGKELSITFSCPNAAELLKNKEKTVKVTNPDNFHFDHGDMYHIRIDDDLVNSTDIKKYYFTIEDHFIDIVQARLFTIDERLILLGLAAKRLESLESPDLTQVSNILEQNKTIMNDLYFKEEAKRIKPTIKHQVILLKEFVNYRLSTINKMELRDILADVSEVFYFDKGDETLKQSMERYIELYSELYLPVQDELSHIFENYLVFFILRKHFAIYDFRDAFFLTIYFYTLIRLVALGIAKKNEKPVDDSILVKAVWVIEKVIGHSHNFYNNILDFMRENNLITVSHGIALLRMPDQIPGQSTPLHELDIPVAK